MKPQWGFSAVHPWASPDLAEKAAPWPFPGARSRANPQARIESNRRFPCPISLELRLRAGQRSRMSYSMLVYRRDATVGKNSFSGRRRGKSLFGKKLALAGSAGVNTAYVEQVTHKGSKYADRAAMRSARLAA